MPRATIVRLSVRKPIFAVVAASAIAFLATPASANLIVNGSFETGDMTGWTTNSPCGLQCYPGYGSGFDGSYWHFLGGYEHQITTSQTVHGLTPGQTYLLQFLMASEVWYKPAGDQLRVSINGGPGTIFTAPNGHNTYWDNWVNADLSFVATGTSETISFDTVGLNSNGYDIGLDNVRLDLANTNGGVPEPASWAMMLLGFAGIGYSVRRAKRRAEPQTA